MRIGIVGLAHVHAAAYAGILADLSGVEFVGVSEPDAGLRERWMPPDGSEVFTAHDALVDSGIDAAIVCTQTNEHLPAVGSLAAAGIHVLCEKPLATNLADAREVVAACSDAGVELMTAFPMRFSPQLSQGARWVADGAVGQILAFNSTNNGHIPTDHAAWFADPEAAGGGAVMDHTVHLVDIMRWWLESDPVEVYATTNRVIHPEAAVETGGIITVTFDSGVVATIDCSWSRPDGWPTWGGLTIDALGTEGTFSVDAFSDRLEMWSGRDTTWVDWGHDPNRAMIEHFVGAIRGDHPLGVTGIDGLRATEVALAAYRSVAAGHPVEV